MFVCSFFCYVVRSVLSSQYLPGEERAVILTVFLVSCGLLYIVSLPRCVVVWSLIFDCGMSCSYSPVLCPFLFGNGLDQNGNANCFVYGILALKCVSLFLCVLIYLSLCVKVIRLQRSGVDTSQVTSDNGNFGERPCLSYILIIGIKNKLT